jgi:DNA-binding response OmpR family regulator
MRRIREKIETDPSNPGLLVTVWGVGYKFEPTRNSPDQTP